MSNLAWMLHLDRGALGHPETNEEQERHMKRKIGKSIVTLIIIAISSMAFAFAADGYPYDAGRPYIGVEHGHADIDGQRVPYIGLTVGSKLSSRTSTEVFARVEPLSAFPGSDFVVSITDTESAFALSVGVSITTRMFRDAAFNPFVQAGISSMAVGHFITEDDDEWILSPLEHTLCGMAATGLEVNVLGGLSIQFLHGYRYVPHREVLGIAPHTLSSSYSSVAFNAYLD